MTDFNINITSNDSILRLTPTMIFVLSVAYAVVFILAIVGNTLVIYTVVKNPRMHTAINYFIVNLSVADILMAICVLPTTLVSNMYKGKFHYSIVFKVWEYSKYWVWVLSIKY